MTPIPHRPRWRRRCWERGAAIVFLALIAMADSPTVVETVLAPRLVAPIQGALAASPYNFLFDPSTNLRLTVANTKAGVTVNVQWRILTRGGQVVVNSQPIVPTTDGIATAFEWNIGDGYLLNATIYASTGTPRRAQTYVILHAIFGTGASSTILGTIAAGYVTATQHRAWPGSPIEGSTDGDGLVRLITGTDPAPTAEIAETVPTGRRWQLLSVAVGLVTSAAGATRRPRLRIHDGVTDWHFNAARDVVGPSSSMTSFWTAGFWQDSTYDGTVIVMGLPVPIVLLAGHGFATATAGLQIGDNYSAPLYSVREWLEV